MAARACSQRCAEFVLARVPRLTCGRSRHPAVVASRPGPPWIWRPSLVALLEAPFGLAGAAALATYFYPARDAQEHVATARALAGAPDVRSGATCATRCAVSMRAFAMPWPVCPRRCRRSGAPDTAESRADPRVPQRAAPRRSRDRARHQDCRRDQRIPVRAGGPAVHPDHLRRVRRSSRRDPCAPLPRRVN